MTDRTRPPPLIREDYMDGPSQRLYAVSIFLALQAWKLWEVRGAHTELYKWILIDVAFVWLLHFLRIPRLRFSVRTKWLQVAFLCLLDYALFGDYKVSTRRLAAFVPLLGFFHREVGLVQDRVHMRALTASDKHLLGKHTVHLLPHSTAKINPNGVCFCVDQRSPIASIPILVNNTKPRLLQYSVYDFDTGRREEFGISARHLQPVKRLGRDGDDDEDDYYDDDVDDVRLVGYSKRPLQAGEQLYILPVRQKGIIQLDRVLDKDKMDMRIAKSEAVVVGCPVAHFPDKWPYKDGIRHSCPGQAAQVNLTVRGFAPLSVGYDRVVSGKVEHQTLSRVAPPGMVSPLLHRDPSAHLSSSDSVALVWNEKADIRAAASSTVNIPLTLDLSTPGLHAYRLDRVEDACGNALDIAGAPDPRTQQSRSREFFVHSLTSVSFSGCDTPRRVRRNESGVINLQVQGGDDFPLSVKVGFQPAASSSTSPWTKSLIMEDKSLQLNISSDPGYYTILSAEGQYCSGDVHVPYECEVQELPKPSANITFESIADQCAGNIGVKAISTLSGEPPFILYYRTHRQGEKPKRKAKTITHLRDEIDFLEKQEGTYTYEFLSLDDANYDNIELKGPSTKVVVHPLASASFTEKKTVVHSCSGDTVKANVELTGTGPWRRLEYSVSSGASVAETYVAENIQSSPFQLEVPIPKRISQDGGYFHISLAAIEDSRGCRRALAQADMEVEVQRDHPTAMFYSPDKSFQAVILDGEWARLPLRLTGEGPWNLSYRHNGSKTIHEVKVDYPNEALRVSQPGLYELVKIKDAFCPGDVIVAESKYVVAVKPRPSMQLQKDAGVLAHNGSVIRPPVCVGTSDSVALLLHGRPPFDVLGKHRTHRTPSYLSRHEHPIALQAAQDTADVQLYTDTAGWHVYSFEKLGDANYAPTTSPADPPLLLEQAVLAAPTASFKSSGRSTQYCLGEKLQARDKKEPMLKLTGTPPFEVDFRVIDETSGNVRQVKGKRIQTTKYALDLDEITFSNVGLWRVEVVHVQDATGCVAKEYDTALAGLTIDVAETASIASLDLNQDVCQGDHISFALQGTSPWLVEYAFNGRKHSTVAKEPTFSRVADETGILEVRSVAHAGNQCKSMANITKIVHPLPRAKVSHGRHYIENIREGDQAEIVFEFEGTPPFTFSYTRSWPEGYSLETHTVANVETHTYTTFAKAEGVFKVIAIADKHCRFPRD